MINMKRGYFVYEKDESGVGVIAKSVTDAKQWAHGGLECEWIDIRVTLVKDANIDGLDYGVVELYEGLRRRFYSYVNDGECEKCGSEGDIQELNGKCICGECYDEIVLGDKT